MRKQLQWAMVGATLALAGLGARPAHAVSCATGDAASYEALGAGGCTIGDKTFSNFNFSSVAVTDANVIVTPGQNILTQGDIGFGLTINGLTTIGPGGSTDLLLKYTVSVNDPDFLISDAHLAFTGGAFGPGGLALVTETLCPPNQPCINKILKVFDSPTATQVSDVANFNGVPTLNISKDMQVFALAGNFASISGVDQTFTQIDTPVPEPSSLLLLGSGLLGLAVVARRK
jgi:PEP-CTERM motif-containing protein